MPRRKSTPQEDPIENGPSPVIEDPMKELFTADGFEPDFSVPEEVQAAFDFYGLSKKDYRCMLKRLDNEEAAEDKASYIRSWARAIPPTDWIGTVYGPGSYILQIQWRGYDPETNVKKTKWMSERIRIKIDDSYDDAHEDYLLKKQIERAQKKKRMIDKAKTKHLLDTSLDDNVPHSEPTDQKTTALEYLKELRKNASELGLVQGTQGIDWQKMASLVVPAIPAVLGYLEQRQQAARQQQQEFIALIMSTLNNSNAQVVDVLKNQNKNPVIDSGANMMKEMRDMVFGAIDIKKAINGDKESVLDRIGGAVEKVLPTIIELSSMSKMQREQDFRYNMAQAAVKRDPAFQQMMNDPQLQQEAIKRWDDFFGWEQTDAILTVAGIERDENITPRLPEKRLPRGSRGATEDVSEEGSVEDGEQA